jgi:hypothetical protein
MGREIILLLIIRINNCPLVNESSFVYGANEYRSFIAAENNVAVKTKLTDTMMWIYDSRIKSLENE